MTGDTLSTVASVHSMLHTTAHPTTTSSLHVWISRDILHPVLATAEVLSFQATVSKVCLRKLDISKKNPISCLQQYYVNYYSVLNFVHLQ